VRSICFLAVDQRRITRNAINSIANARSTDGNGAGFAGAPVAVISGAGVIVAVGAGVLLVEDVGIGDGDLFKGQSIVVTGGFSVFSSNLASTVPSTLVSTYLMTFLPAIF